MISCPQVEAPVMLHCGWKGYFEPTLFARDGLPTTLFYFVRGGMIAGGFVQERIFLNPESAGS